MILDHVGLSVTDLKASHAFYAQALAPLDIKFIKEIGGWDGFGAEDQRPEFWLGVGARPQVRMHIAFAARTRDQVRQFYQAALAAGGKENVTPCIMNIYHANFYAAMVFDPDGNNIEAVCHAPQ